MLFVYLLFYDFVEEVGVEIEWVLLCDIGICWELDFDGICVVFDDGVIVILLCNLYNLIGIVYDCDSLVVFVELVEEFGVVVVFDEIYVLFV